MGKSLEELEGASGGADRASSAYHLTEVERAGEIGDALLLSLENAEEDAREGDGEGAQSRVVV